MIDHLTGAATPRMPLSRDPLPAREIELVRRWVAGGARDDAGQVPYAGSRRKLYVTNQASDKISVIDADAMVVMRLIDVGVLPNVDSRHNVHVDRQGRYWYVALINSARLLQFDAETDSLRAMAVVGQSPANPVASPDGRAVYVTNWNPNNATLHALDAESLTEKYVLYQPRLEKRHAQLKSAYHVAPVLLKNEGRVPQPASHPGRRFQARSNLSAGRVTISTSGCAESAV